MNKDHKINFGSTSQSPALLAAKIKGGKQLFLNNNASEIQVKDTDYDYYFFMACVDSLSLSIAINNASFSGIYL